MNEEKELAQATQVLRDALGDNITWKYEERLNVMLSEFAQNKSAVVLENLRHCLCDEWHVKTVKKLPKPLKEQLGDLAKLNKEQKILAQSGSVDSPTIVALWWPWGHGGTYSLRLKLIDTTYEMTPEPDSSGVIGWFKSLVT